MLKHGKRFKPAPLNQPPLIETEPAIKPGSFDVSLVLKNAITEAIKQCNLSRYEVASKVSELTGHDLTKAMLDQYTAESREDCCMPARWLNALCFVTGTLEPINVLLEPLDAIAVSGEERQALELMQIEREIQVLERRKKELRATNGLSA